MKEAHWDHTMKKHTRDHTMKKHCPAPATLFGLAQNMAKTLCTLMYEAVVDARRNGALMVLLGLGRYNRPII